MPVHVIDIDLPKQRSNVPLERNRHFLSLSFNNRFILHTMLQTSAREAEQFACGDIRITHRVLRPMPTLASVAIKPEVGRGIY